MKLSDAIATGRVLLKPVAGTVDDLHGGGCAIGMALSAIGHRHNDEWDCLRVHWPWTAHWPWMAHYLVNTIMPCGCEVDFTVLPHMNHVGGTITHIFDFHVFGKGDWTLDQLIDWVRSIEPAEQPTPSLPEALAESAACAEVGETIEFSE